MRRPTAESALSQDDGFLRLVKALFGVIMMVRQVVERRFKLCLPTVHIALPGPSMLHSPPHADRAAGVSSLASSLGRRCGLTSGLLERVESRAPEVERALGRKSAFCTDLHSKELYVVRAC